MLILAIDPGSFESGYVVYDVEEHSIVKSGVIGNEKFIKLILGGSFDLIDQVAIEYIQPRGQTLYTQIVDTIFWSGRIVQAMNREWYPIDRKDVKMTLCEDPRVNNSNIRAALISLFEPTGGGSIQQIGIKKKPGPLYHVKSHAWSALGVAITHTQLNLKGK